MYGFYIGAKQCIYVYVYIKITVIFLLNPIPYFRGGIEHRGRRHRSHEIKCGYDIYENIINFENDLSKQYDLCI